MTIFSEFHFGLVLLVFSIHSYSIDGRTIENPVQLSRDDYCPPQYKRKHILTLQHESLFIRCTIFLQFVVTKRPQLRREKLHSQIQLETHRNECYFDIFAPVGQYVQMTCSDVYRSAWTNYFSVMNAPAISTLICFQTNSFLFFLILAAWNGRDFRESACPQKDLHFVRQSNGHIVASD